MEVVFKPKLNVPLPVMALVTSNSTIVPIVTFPNVLNAEPPMVGALLKFKPFSVHGLAVPRKLFETANIEPP